MRHEKLKRQVVSGFAWEGVTKLVIQTVSWGSTIIVARILMPSDYGIVAISGVFIGLLAIITDMGLSEGLINTASVTIEDQDTIFWLSLLLGTLIYGVLFFLAPYISNIYQMEMLTEIMRTAAFVLIFSSLKVVPVALAMRNMDFRFRSLVEMAGQLASVVTVITLAMLGFGAWSLVWAMLVSQLVITIAYLHLLKSAPRFTFKLRETWPIISFGGKLMTSRIIGFFMLESPVFIIGFFLGQKAAGYYSMAAILAMMPMDKIGSIFNRITFPALSKIKSNRSQSRALFLDMHHYLLIISYPILIGLMLVADDLILFFLTEKWMSIIPLIKILCAINLIRVSGMLMPPALEGTGHVNRVLYFHVMAIIILPIAYVIGVNWGLEGVLYSWMLAYPPLYMYLIFSVFRVLNINLIEFINTIISPVVASLLMVLVVAAVQYISVDMPIFINLLLTVLVGALTYLATYFIFYRDELARIRRGLYSLKKGKATV